VKAKNSLNTMWEKWTFSGGIPHQLATGSYVSHKLPLHVILFTYLQREICADIQRIGQQQFVGR